MKSRVAFVGVALLSVCAVSSRGLAEEYPTGDLVCNPEDQQNTVLAIYADQFNPGVDYQLRPVVMPYYGFGTVWPILGDEQAPGGYQVYHGVVEVPKSPTAEMDPPPGN